MNTQKILFYRAAGIDNEEIARHIEDQANFYIDWHYDYLVRKELDNTDSKALSQEQLDKLKQKAVSHYQASNENFINDLKAIGA